MIKYDIDYIQFMLMFRSAVRTSDIRVCKVRGDGGRGADGGDTRDTAALLLYNYTSAPHRASQPPPGAAYTSPSIMRILYAV